MHETPFARLRLALFLVPVAVLVAAAACGGEEEAPSGGTPTQRATATPAAAAPTTAPAANANGCPAASLTAPEVQVKKYDQRPAMTIDPARNYAATVRTVRGDFTIQLRPDLAPEHVNSFVLLARDGYFNGIVFHRVEPGFVIQGGDPTGTGSGGPGYTIPAEFTDKEKFVRGVVGMARTSDPNSAGSQWFVTLGDAHHLDGQYTIFGTVTSGMDVVDCIQRGDAMVSVDVTEQ